jgi:hypothetical protein
MVQSAISKSTRHVVSRCCHQITLVFVRDIVELSVIVLHALCYVARVLAVGVETLVIGIKC